MPRKSALEKRDVALEKGMPMNADAERFILGSVLLKSDRFVEVAGVVTIDDFAIQKHKLIWTRMVDLFEQGAPIDRVSIANELLRYGELEIVDGLSYLVSLDDGLPQISNIDHYCEIIRECSRARRLAILGQQVMNKALSRDPSSEIVEYGFGEFLKIGAEAERKGLTSTHEVIVGYPGGINALLGSTPRVPGIQTGFTKLDEMTGGLRGGELIILAARPSMGKTALVLNAASHAARQGSPVGIFSLEMSKESLVERMICSRARVDLHQLRSGFSTESERGRLRRAAGEIAGWPLYVDDSADIGLMDIHAKARRMQAEHGLALLIVDYLQLMSMPGDSNRNEELGSISRGLKILSKELNIPIVVLSQLSRGPETRAGDHRPKLSDLRESGAIEQDADIVAFVFREELYKRDREDLRGQAELIIAKQRNGPIGTVDLVFLGGIVKFENKAEDMPAGETY
jgi:replicative DNA helicase